MHICYVEYTIGAVLGSLIILLQFIKGADCPDQKVSFCKLCMMHVSMFKILDIQGQNLTPQCFEIKKMGEVSNTVDKCQGENIIQ